MIYNVIFTDQSRKEFAKLPPITRKRVVEYLDKKVQHQPFAFGRALVGNKNGYWRYRVGDYRIICQIHNDTCVVLILNIGHRGHIYD